MIQKKNVQAFIVLSMCCLSLWQLLCVTLCFSCVEETVSLSSCFHETSGNTKLWIQKIGLLRVWLMGRELMIRARSFCAAGVQAINPAILAAKRHWAICGKGTHGGQICQFPTALGAWVRRNWKLIWKLLWRQMLTENLKCLWEKREAQAQTLQVSSGKIGGGNPRMPNSSNNH